MVDKKTTYKKVTTPFFRVSFPELFEAKSFKDGKPKFSVQMLFPKKTTNMDILRGEVKRAALEFFGKKKPYGFVDPIKNGDELLTQDGEENEHTKGYWVIRTSSFRKPGVIDKDRTTITAEEADKVYPGCWARATINAYGYDNVNRGVSFGLNNVQKVKDDEPFVPERNPEDDFDDIEEIKGDDETSSDDW